MKRLLFPFPHTRDNDAGNNNDNNGDINICSFAKVITLLSHGLALVFIMNRVQLYMIE